MSADPPPGGGSGARGPSRRSLLGGLGALPALLSVGWARDDRDRGDPRPQGPPDLLVLVADDLSRINLGCPGHAGATTPNLERLAGEGLSFERAYTPVGLCTPSRTSMYTGLYPSLHGAAGFDPIREGIPTCPELLNPHGIATGLIGKLNVSPAARFPFEYLWRPEGLVRTRAGDGFSSALAEFLDLAGERPYVCFVNFEDPHRPFGGGAAPASKARKLRERARPELFPFLWDTPATRRDLADYYDAIARMDETLGQVLAVLDGSPRARETLVVFTSDNGMPFPFGKATLYEAGINLPLIVRWPGVVPSGGTSRALVSLIDLLPSMLELHGLPTGNLHGRSLLPLLRGEVEAVREDFFAMHTSQRIGEDYPSRSLRFGDLKYIRNLRPQTSFENSALNSLTWESWVALAAKGSAPGLQEHMDRLIRRPAEELYDLAADPFERRDLAQHPERAELLADMRARLAGRMREFADQAGLDAGAPPDQGAPGDADR